MFLPYITPTFTTLIHILLSSHLQEWLRPSTCLFSVSNASCYLPLLWQQSLQYKMQIQTHCKSDPQKLPYNFQDKMKCLNSPSLLHRENTSSHFIQRSACCFTGHSCFHMVLPYLECSSFLPPQSSFPLPGHCHWFPQLLLEPFPCLLLC